MKDLIQNRIKHLQTIMVQNGLQAIALNPGPDLTYFSGLHFHLMERPVLLVLLQTGSPLIIIPELEERKIEDFPIPIRDYQFNEDPNTWPDVFQAALKEGGILQGKIGVISRRLRMLELTYLQKAAPDLEFEDVQDLVAEMRMQKDDTETAWMREAVRIAECALSAILPSIKPGDTEKEIASRLVGRLFAEGSDPALPFFPIVSFGENSANPHTRFQVIELSEKVTWS